MRLRYHIYSNDMFHIVSYEMYPIWLNTSLSADSCSRPCFCELLSLFMNGNGFHEIHSFAITPKSHSILIRYCNFIKLKKDIYK